MTSKTIARDVKNNRYRYLKQLQETSKTQSPQKNNKTQKTQCPPHHINHK